MLASAQGWHEAMGRGYVGWGSGGGWGYGALPERPGAAAKKKIRSMELVRVSIWVRSSIVRGVRCVLRRKTARHSWPFERCLSAVSRIKIGLDF